MSNHPTIEISIEGQRYRAEERRRGWFLIEFWDDTEVFGEEFGWSILLPKEQLRVERSGPWWTPVRSAA